MTQTEFEIKLELAQALFKTARVAQEYAELRSRSVVVNEADKVTRREVEGQPLPENEFGAVMDQAQRAGVLAMVTSNDFESKRAAWWRAGEVWKDVFHAFNDVANLHTALQQERVQRQVESLDDAALDSTSTSAKHL